jgi:hypothetical protein
MSENGENLVATVVCFAGELRRKLWENRNYNFTQCSLQKADLEARQPIAGTYHDSDHMVQVI